MLVEEHALSLQDLIAQGLAFRDSDGWYRYAIPSECSIQVKQGAIEYQIQPALPEATLPKAGVRCSLLPYLGGVALIILICSQLMPSTDRAVDSMDVAIDSKQETINYAIRLRSRPQESSGSRHMQQRTRPRRQPVESRAIETPETEVEPPTTKRKRHIAAARKSGVLAIVSIVDDPVVMEAITAQNFDLDEGRLELYKDRPKNLHGDAWGHGVTKLGPGSGDGQDWGTIAATPPEKEGDIGASYVAKALKTRQKVSTVSAAERTIARTIATSGLSNDVIRGHLRMSKRLFRKCFEKGDSVVPNNIVLGFRVSTSGVLNPTSVNKGFDEQVRSCLKKTLVSIQLPRPSDGKTIDVKGFSLRI